MLARFVFVGDLRKFVRAKISQFLQYRSLSKERPWAEHLTGLPKREGVGALSTAPAFNHERAHVMFTATQSP